MLDRFGRRFPLMIAGGVGLILLAVIFLVGASPDDAYALVGGVHLEELLLLPFMLTIALGVGLIMWACLQKSKSVSYTHLAMFRYWTEDEFATLFRQMLTVEQYRTPELGALYRRYFIETPLAWQERLFASMMEAGAFVRDNPRLLALEFFAPLMLLIQAADGAAEASDRERLVDLARQHVTRFGERHACALGAEGPE